MNIFMKMFVLWLLIFTQSIYAGSQSSAEALLDPEEITTFAKDVEKYAASKGARAFIIARMGFPESDMPKGITFSHTAIAIYSSIQLSNGETVNGYAIHNLYQDAESATKSNLVVDYPVDFFWSAYALKAGIIIPSKDLQQRLVETISSGKNALLHNDKYSLLSNPFNAKLQNCTEYTLDIINASIYQTTDIQQLKRNAKEYFKPQRIRKTLKLVLGSLFNSDITTSDHNGRLFTSTFTTIGQYLESNQLAEQVVILGKNGSITSLLDT